MLSSPVGQLSWLTSPRRERAERASSCFPCSLAEPGYAGPAPYPNLLCFWGWGSGQCRDSGLPASCRHQTGPSTNSSLDGRGEPPAGAICLRPTSLVVPGLPTAQGSKMRSEKEVEIYLYRKAGDRRSPRQSCSRRGSVICGLPPPFSFLSDLINLSLFKGNTREILVCDGSLS